MKSHFVITLIIVLTNIGCSPSDTRRGAITVSKVQLSADPKNKTDATSVVITNQQALIQLNQFLENHSSGWKTPQNAPPSPDDFVVIYKVSGESFNLGYSSNMLFKYKWGHDKCKHVDPVQLETFKELLNALREN